MKSALAKVYVNELLNEIGPGFHPDTDICDYVPELKNQEELQYKLDFALEHINCDIYEYAMNLYVKKFKH